MYAICITSFVCVWSKINRKNWEKFMEIQYHFLPWATFCQIQCWLGFSSVIENMNECVVHMLPPAIKNANAMVFIYGLFVHTFYSFLDRKSYLYTHWIAALTIVNFVATIFTFFFYPFSSFSFLILLLLYFSWKNANNWWTMFYFWIPTHSKHTHTHKQYSLTFWHFTKQMCWIIEWEWCFQCQIIH